MSESHDYRNDIPLCKVQRIKPVNDNIQLLASIDYMINQVRIRLDDIYQNRSSVSDFLSVASFVEIYMKTLMKFCEERLRITSQNNSNEQDSCLTDSLEGGIIVKAKSICNNIRLCLENPGYENNISIIGYSVQYIGEIVKDLKRIHQID